MGSFVPCSPRHHHCSPAHASLVAGYRAERERQLVLFEAETGNYKGDIKWHKENGHELITFKKWLKSNKRVEHADGNLDQNTEGQNFVQTSANMNQNEVDQIFNQMTEDFMTEVPAENVAPTDIVISSMIVEGTQNEEECNCDCDMCCRNDHIACCNDNDPCCLSGP